MRQRLFIEQKPALENLPALQMSSTILIAHDSQLGHLRSQNDSNTWRNHNRRWSSDYVNASVAFFGGIRPEKD